LGFLVYPLWPDPFPRPFFFFFVLAFLRSSKIVTSFFSSGYCASWSLAFGVGLYLESFFFLFFFLPLTCTTCHHYAASHPLFPPFGRDDHLRHGLFWALAAPLFLCAMIWKRYSSPCLASFSPISPESRINFLASRPLDPRGALLRLSNRF